jgi:hypothetical protein
MSYLNRRLVRPVRVYTRHPAGKDDQGNETYGTDFYDTLCYAQIQSRQESLDGRSSDQLYLVLLRADDVEAHSLDTFSWLDIEGIGRVEVDGDPALWRALSSSSTVHHVEVLARRSSSL